MRTMASQSQSHRIRGRRWQAIRRAILSEEPLCRACLTQGRTVIAEEIDHIVPLEHGGTDTPENYQPLCKSCHQTKTTGRAMTGLDGWPIAAGAGQISASSVLEPGGHPKQI